MVEPIERFCDNCIHAQKCESFPYCSDNYLPNTIIDTCPICKSNDLEFTEEDLRAGVEWFYCRNCDITGRFYYEVKYVRVEMDND